MVNALIDRDALIESALEWIELLERTMGTTGVTSPDERYIRAVVIVDVIILPVLSGVR